MPSAAKNTKNAGAVRGTNGGREKVIPILSDVVAQLHRALLEVTRIPLLNHSAHAGRKKKAVRPAIQGNPPVPLAELAGPARQCGFLIISTIS
jgi:hypothetical protein